MTQQLKRNVRLVACFVGGLMLGIGLTFMLATPDVQRTNKDKELVERYDKALRQCLGL